MPIVRLDEATVRRIAAGEVVERPASVVKELVENALDAGARTIRVEVVAGGRELIRVQDDGCGIPAEELPLAVERHATSKLRRFEDLARLASYGFRGEALAAISAVSDFEIASRPSEASHGGRLRVRFGKSGRIEPVGMPVGTIVTVRDLFANVPARRRFLRQDATETAYIHRVLAALALARPDVRVELVVDRRTVLTTPGSGRLVDALAGVYGAETAAKIVPLEPTNSGDVVVHGAIGLPVVARANRQALFVLVNGRWIESRTLVAAIEQAYHTLLMVGRYPIGVVAVSLPPDRVDVNVHPTKREVRFADERVVAAAVHEAVRRTLLCHLPTQPPPAVTFNPLEQPVVQRRLLVADPSRVPVPAPLPSSPTANSREASAGASPAEGRLPVLRVLGQVRQSYIIAEGPDGMYLIDQHAAHERILLEQLLEQLATRGVEQQRLLEPLVLELSPQQLEASERYAGDLRQLGWEVEPFGGASVAVRAVPRVVQRNIERVLTAVLDDLASGGRGTTPLECVAISTACHSAIRAGQELSLPEMRELIRQLEQCRAPNACGHGRPTVVHLSTEELERHFGRR
ncbi:DNA mismatch repair endonuclease MutL [Thermomicrobium sp. 4228-Ro]|uniref:DNA mismatch repair endonuclease MutL n=1 Tax=Thermomicrobium sp. 4228-Ro TaxID=2993937 RepID=UPI0022487A6A|nr:DNA mismatch repair endonuclease MutL [Thermomicrobium sp. 4228-Ro]MCX2727201.1 DNA mismatch repair endonuclease MutL [Thermomicrobium sp. 4228-Ro]